MACDPVSPFDFVPMDVLKLILCEKKLYEDKNVNAITTFKRVCSVWNACMKDLIYSLLNGSIPLCYVPKIHSAFQENRKKIRRRLNREFFCLLTFSRLTELDLRGMEKLDKIRFSSIVRQTPHIQKIALSHLDFGIEVLKECSLKEIKIEKSIIPHFDFLIPQNQLQTLVLKECSSKKYIPNLSTITSLKKLSVQNCEYFKRSLIFSLQRLPENLEKLSVSCQGTHQLRGWSSLTQLQKLSLHTFTAFPLPLLCTKLASLHTLSLNMPKIEREFIDSLPKNITRLNFSGLKVRLNMISLLDLKEIRMNNCDSSINLWNPLKLKKITIESSSNFLLLNVGAVEDLSFVLCMDIKESYFSYLPHLKKLNIFDFKSLKKLDLNALAKLEELSITSMCLKKIFAASLTNLTVINLNCKFLNRFDFSSEKLKFAFINAPKRILYNLRKTGVIVLPYT